jgi:lysophospholipase L1-like esterase
MLIDSGATLVMIGDSITDAGRDRPVGMDEGIGWGYVRIVASMLAASYPERRIQVLNTGISGNTVRDLDRRWSSDVIALKPTWLSVMIGTNDVWRYFDPENQFSAVDFDEFETTYRNLLGQVQPSLKGTVLMTPFYVQSDRREAMRSRMDQYGKIVKKIADDTGSLFADTQAEFNTAMEHINPLDLAPDGVHPTLYGSGVLARAFLKAIEFEI